ncbi:murein transglycosylase A [Actinobacillus succinogenes]|uniref:Membrane-bound lytic murein transglycosylase A n=1 Tax=Actinobacillus succinogenes (strain ATCC 55618 / DSM 22257 / CCUG 43843 / 130Z) TaxID=339671 RepID=A6VQ89_ACTSZ|nr:murein transglycosylase A [Actinobacillus succinogenes]ABR75136.1 MltA domain protein [Actinobacillus succinogenes 130Z]PHI40467.1 murein transglycosylase A [Actinobacillus succinogenes]
MKKKIVFRTLTVIAAMMLVACSSSKTAKSPSARVTAQASNAEMMQFGAKYKGRSYNTMPFATVSRIDVDGNDGIVNQGDFLTQISNVRNYSGRISSAFAANYNKIQQWVVSGANINELTNFGIHPQIMSGMDGFQNVLMTGYYSPVIKVRGSRQGEFQQPIYALPAQKRFTRAQIYNGALDGKGLELAYSNSMIDNFLLGVQGSGFVDYGNGRLQYLAYAGQNGYPYTAIARLLVEDGEIPKEKMSVQAIREWAARNPSRLQELLERNESYVYFKHDPSGQVKGAAGVPLIPMAAVASDKHLIPMGSVLLVEVPEIDNAGNWTGTHHLNLMVALDVGGAVNSHHFDLYRGVGDDAGHISGLSKHYGRVWVLR